MNVGLLTGGGDCPGLNAVIRAVVRRVAAAGGRCTGILEGWRGLIREMTVPLTVAETHGIVGLGGTILGSSRTNPYKNPETDVASVRAHFEALGLDALVAVGGDDTLGVALRLHKDFRFPVVGVPKTIDNDLDAADFSFGFDTAVNIVVEAADRLRTTGESHRRVMVLETMGRRCGWIACYAGMAAGADYILVPEVPVDLGRMLDSLARRRQAGRHSALVVVAEGARLEGPADPACYPPRDAPGMPRPEGIGASVAWIIENRARVETRTLVLGHMQRGGIPTAADRVLATRLGLAAADLALRRRFGTLLTHRGGQIAEAPLTAENIGPRSLDLAYYDAAAASFA
ncbi:Pyrophosphate--fructose 6-phosphate 1-phosphotransferase [Aquisphaera giovannonii]|uniref:Pyrophosphate--fructose 6-phosphate 1-phosphotransferase n=1 Tax=Aquisphaera giovannonii TaxID=406548 RepID=A0A5B9WCH1_9BACT|nr:ATP-dependent 6-phosphofructokinase [Aquisphaera giovannonii]QEH38306.1 Pyrophosphate--fructose 6-phosphate 1-phosphotransferase [Aquisphaera giovannonii]